MKMSIHTMILAAVACTSFFAASQTSAPSKASPRSTTPATSPQTAAPAITPRPVPSPTPTPPKPNPALVLGATRPIASMTADERTHLPDNTMVTLTSGRTVSLGTLRAEHRARLERFSRAAGLGQMVAGILTAQPTSAAQQSPSATGNVRSATGPAPRNGGVNAGAVMQSPSQVGRAVSLFDIVPLQIPTVGGRIPKDYVDFCKAAGASACIYLPANTTLDDGNTYGSTHWIWERDFLLMDKSICEYDGGYYGGYYSNTECDFEYPVTQLTTFKPTGPISTKASCNPPAKYVVDPKGAIQVTYPFPTTFTTGGTPITCVVKVWVGK